jgi:hypothetical protein
VSNKLGQVDALVRLRHLRFDIIVHAFSTAITHGRAHIVLNVLDLVFLDAATRHDLFDLVWNIEFQRFFLHDKVLHVLHVLTEKVLGTAHGHFALTFHLCHRFLL